MIVIASVPFVVFAASSLAVLGGTAVVSNLLFGGQAIAYLTVGLLTALTPIAIVSGTVPLAGATLKALMCFGVGLSLLAPRAGTSVLVKASDEPWLTAGGVLDGGLARLKTGAQRGWLVPCGRAGAAATPWAGLAPCTVDATCRRPGRRSSHACRRRQGRQEARARSHDPAT